MPVVKQPTPREPNTRVAQLGTPITRKEGEKVVEKTFNELLGRGNGPREYPGGQYSLTGEWLECGCGATQSIPHTDKCKHHPKWERKGRR